MDVGEVERIVLVRKEVFGIVDEDMYGVNLCLLLFKGGV